MHLTQGFRASDPADPGYNFSTLDASVRSATANGQHLLLQLLAAPSWALGLGAPASAPPDTWRPNARALGAFAHALAQRYSGRFPDPRNRRRMLPRVTYFQVWDEPNLPTYLTPQWTRTATGSFVPGSPGIYRQMLNAAYAGIKAAQRHAYVLAAGTAPYGDRPGVGRMAPVMFWRELLCLHGQALRPERCRNPAHFDAADHHPYAATPTVHAFRKDDVSVPDLGRIARVLRAAERAHRVLPRGRKPLWVTEIDWDSNPPDPYSKIPLRKQARYLSLGFYELWRQGVGHVFWFLMRDIRYYSLTGSGLYFLSNRAKPSMAAFRFPFVALGSRNRELTLWGHAPHAGAVTIERAAGHGWRRFIRLRTTRGGIFYAIRRAGSRLMLRARQGAIASLAFDSG
jgi:hypothetical protein